MFQKCTSRQLKNRSNLSKYESSNQNLLTEILSKHQTTAKAAINTNINDPKINVEKQGKSMRVTN